MKITNLENVAPKKDWFGVKSKVEKYVTEPVPRDNQDCSGGGISLMYFDMEAGEMFPFHYHPNSRIITIWKGYGYAIIGPKEDQKEYQLKTHDCFSMPPNTRHTFSAGPEGLTILSVHSTSIDPEDPAFMTLCE